ncbi:DUF2165 family protein [Poriferisphaera sp. WC338]|uniref:DUF2165 family protein n=1 Tax=Poriferisphaera sp. WC338 TaxID=3425129 RepID=UPI003D819BB8
MTTFILRLAKILITASFALWMTIITFTNITHPQLNQNEVSQTLTMYTLPDIPPDAFPLNRAISNSTFANTTFDFIILIQALAAVALTLGSLNLLFFSFQTQATFHRAKWLASLGYLIAILFFLLFLVTFASEYFITYRSTRPALQNLQFQGIFNTILLITALAFLIQPESMPITRTPSNKPSNNHPSASKSQTPVAPTQYPDVQQPPSPKPTPKPKQP